MDQREIDALMTKHQEPAIMAYRPYPPLSLPRANSHLGGRPALPAGIDWPRTGAGVPLHFLSQIDCAELPPSGGVLPDQGVLFFFARIDEEMLWGDGDPTDDCRVLFAPRIGSSEARAPDDLPPLMGGYSDLQKHFALPDDPPVTLYPRWPLVFHGINSWPDISALGKWDNDYQAAVRQARGAEVIRVLDLATNERREPNWNKLYVSSPRDPIVLPPDVGGQIFPQVWVMIDRIARHVVKGPVAGMRKSESGLSSEQLSMTEAAAKRWVDLAKRARLDQAVDPATAREFAAWLQTVADLHHNLRAGVQRAVAFGMRSTVQFAASSPSAAALIPAVYYEELEGEHRPARLSRTGPATAPLQPGLSRSYHQMLGNAKSTQQARSVARDEVLLLQLNSDYGVNFMFCDVGEVEFWIDKRDLAARRFGKVSASTCGG